jgi:hypothetical protein
MVRLLPAAVKQIQLARPVTPPTGFTDRPKRKPDRLRAKYDPKRGGYYF